MLIYSAILAAVVNGETIHLAYRKPSGILTVRQFAPYSVTRCQNGNTTVNGHCPHDGHPKSLTLANIITVGKDEATVFRAL